MLSVKEKGLLIHIVGHCKRIEEKIEGVSIDAFDRDEDVKEIVCFNLIQIGELAKSLPPEFLVEHNGVPWRDIKGMRDRVAHGYGVIDLDMVWATAAKDIRVLREYCESILRENG